MFPEDFVRKHLIWAKRDDMVLDPFSGRGTTLFEAMDYGRDVIACDVNPVAICISRAKSRIPPMRSILNRLDEIRISYRYSEPAIDGAFFNWCFHNQTLAQILYLREVLKWRSSSIDCFLAAVALGRLHGESHKSPAYFSNRMPRTVSTKPDYSVRWWQKNGYHPPLRDIFDIIKSDVIYRYASDIPKGRGRMRAGDARNVSKLFPDAREKVGLVITSPPYLDTTDFEEDQWLRLWFLGGPERPAPRSGKDHRHYNAEAYWKFLEEAWSGLQPLLKSDARLVIRLGGHKLSVDQAEAGLARTLSKALGGRLELVERHVSSIQKSQLRSFNPSSVSAKEEYDFHWLLAA